MGLGVTYGNSLGPPLLKRMEQHERSEGHVSLASLMSVMELESLFSPFIAWMVLYNLGAQAVSIDVGVNLGSTYVFVAEHALDNAQVGASLEQVRSKGMAQGMRTDGLRDAGLLSQLLDEMQFLRCFFHRETHLCIKMYYLCTA